MRIEIRGASEHNLKDVDVELGDGLTVVTGVSGSGKTSLVFDTLYHEARRRFLEIFGSSAPRQSPAQVRSDHRPGPGSGGRPESAQPQPRFYARLGLGAASVSATALCPFWRAPLCSLWSGPCGADGR